MDFLFYRLNGEVRALESAGTRVLLRDKNDEIVDLCNDGNYYCGVNFFDWTQNVTRQLWINHLMNATRVGNVSGVFADHATQSIKIPKGGTEPQMCNGAGSLRKCYNFTTEFAVDFNASHAWLINYTQNALSEMNGAGPVVDGPYARWHSDPCDFRGFRETVQAGQNGTGPYIIEANAGGACQAGANTGEDASCLASFLINMQKYSYLSCFSDVPPWYPSFEYPLGEPMSDGVEVSTGVWERNFSNKAGITTAKYDESTGTGSVAFAGVPSPPPPPPIPSGCGTIKKDTRVGQDDIAHFKTVSSAAECCEACQKVPGCLIWCFHGESGRQHNECHFHGNSSVITSGSGPVAGFMNHTF